MVFFWPADLTLLTKCFKNKKANISAIRGARELLFFFKQEPITQAIIFIMLFHAKMFKFLFKVKVKANKAKKVSKKKPL